jgi:hypothetical protein
VITDGGSVVEPPSVDAPARGYCLIHQSSIFHISEAVEGFLRKF